MKPRFFPAVVSGIVLALGALICGVFFFLRSPVLIVTGASFAALHGGEPLPSVLSRLGGRRLLRERLRASLTLLRPVKPVLIADDSGADMLAFALEEASSRPFCVLFPRHFFQAARYYREQFPQTPAALLEGRSGPVIGINSADFFVFGTESELDFYRAGRSAALLSAGKPGRIVFFQGRDFQTAHREAFLRGLREQGYTESPLFLTEHAQLGESPAVSCMVLAGSGAEYLDKNPDFPIVLFTWMDPALTSREVAVIFDDSPWTQAVSAARLITAGERAGKIASRPLIFSARIADKNILRQLKIAIGAK